MAANQMADETVVAAQWSYVVGPHGRVTAAVLHQDGYLRRWVRTSKSDYDADAAALQQRITANKPLPGRRRRYRRLALPRDPFILTGATRMLIGSRTTNRPLHL